MPEQEQVLWDRKQVRLQYALRFGLYRVAIAACASARQLGSRRSARAIFSTPRKSLPQLVAGGTADPDGC
jgi:hypothetical protein